MNTSPLIPMICFVAALSRPVVGSVVDPVHAVIDIDSAWTGEAVPLTVTLFSPGPFAGTASFDLPELPQTVILKTGRPSVGSKTIDGHSWFTQRHQFLIFTRQSGEIVIPEFDVHFSSRKTFTSDPEPVMDRTQETRFLSKRPPGTESAGFVIVASAMTSIQTWTPDTLSLQAGDIVQRTVTRRAGGTTAMMLTPVPDARIAGVRIYVSGPQIQDNTTRGELTAERTDTIRYQFEQPGTFTLPPIEFVWWDSGADELRRDVLPGTTIDVLNNPPNTDLSPDQTEESGRAEQNSVLPAVCAFFMAAAAGFIVILWWFRRQNPESLAAAALLRALRARDARSTYDCVLAWKRVSGVSAFDFDRLLKSLPKGNLFLHEVNVVAAACFGDDRPRDGWSAERLGYAFRKVRHELLTANHNRKPGELASLNPEPPSRSHRPTP